MNSKIEGENETNGKNVIVWAARDAWLCVLSLIVSQAIVTFWLRYGANSSPAFSLWLRTVYGLGFTVAVQGSIWLFFAVLFSHVQVGREFLEPAGLKRGVNMFGWCAAWLAIGIAFINHYGAIRGLTASAKLHPVGYDSDGVFWCFFVLKTIVLVSFYEEVVTRGFIYSAFRGSYGTLFSICLIVCFSAYFHWSSVSRSLFTFGCLASLWILLCVVREKTGSLWNCLLCHAVYNSIGIYFWIPTIIAMLLIFLVVVHPFFVKSRTAAWRYLK